MKKQLSKCLLACTLMAGSLAISSAAQAFGFMYNDFYSGAYTRPVFCKYVPAHVYHHRLYPAHTSCFLTHGYGRGYYDGRYYGYGYGCGCNRNYNGGYYYTSQRVSVEYGYATCNTCNTCSSCN